MKTKINLILTLLVLMMASLGCESNISFTTANISDLKFGTNKTADPQNGIFSPTDKIYVVSAVHNTPAKHKVEVVLYYDDVNGEEPGSVAKDFGIRDVPGECSFSFSVYAVRGQLPTGLYRAEAILLDEDGTKELDRKEGTFEVLADNEW
jgi:hypothetical protein